MFNLKGLGKRQLSVYFFIIGMGSLFLLFPGDSWAQEGNGEAFQQRRQAYIDKVISVADRTFVDCQDYSEDNGVVLLSRNNLWALFEVDKYPQVRRCMIKNMLYNLENNVSCWEEIDDEIHASCGPDTVGILEESKIEEGEGDENGNGKPDWMDTLDDTQGFFMSVGYDNSLIMRVFYQYADQVPSDLLTEAENYFIDNFLVDGCFQISGNPNQRIQSIVGVYLWLERHPEDRDREFSYMTGPCSNYGTWEQFSCGGRSYQSGGTYNLWQYAQDYLNCVLFDNFAFGKGDYTNEFDATYSHPYFVGFNVLYDLAQDEKIKEKAKMALEIFDLDYFMDYGEDQHCGLRGRGKYYTQRSENSTAYIWHGLSENYADNTPAPFPSPDRYISDYCTPVVVQDVIDTSEESDAYWRDHKEYNEELSGDKGKGTYITKAYAIGGPYGDWRGGWRINMQPKGNCGVDVVLFSSDQYSEDPYDELNGGSPVFYQYRYAAYAPSGIYEYIVSDCAFDVDEERSGWHFLKLGKSMVAFDITSMEAAVEGVDYPSYESFRDAVINNARMDGNCFVTSRGDRICSTEDLVGTINGQPLHQFPFDRIETETNSGKEIDWNNNVMAVNKNGRRCEYDFNTWTMSGDCACSNGPNQAPFPPAMNYEGRE